MLRPLSTTAWASRSRAASIGANLVWSVVRIVPNHTCVVSNLFDRMVFHRNGIVTRVEDVAARGTVW